MRLAKIFIPALLLAAMAPQAGLAETDVAESATDSAACPHHAAHHGDHAGHMGGMGKMGMGGGDPAAMFDKAFGELGLTDTQKQDIATLVQMYGERLQEIAKRGEAARRELLTLSPLEPAYGTLTNEVSQEAAASAAETVNLLSELQRTAFLLLTNEQQTRYLELRAERRAQMQARMAEMRAQRAARMQEMRCSRPNAPADCAAE